MNDNKEYGIFSECQFIKSIHEESILGLVFTTAVSAVVAGVKYYADKKKKLAKDEAEKSRIRKVIEDNANKDISELEYVKAFGKAYGISVDELREPEKEYKNNKEAYEDMLTDAKKFASKILNSQLFKANVEELIKDEEKLDYCLCGYGNSRPKPTLSHFKSIVKIEEGVNGYDESMQILDGTQEENVEFGWIAYDIGNMLDIKYAEWLHYGVSNGDGDEGHIYYQIRVRPNM